MDGRKRTVQIKFRVTEAERDLIEEKMKLIPTRNMAAYLRKIAIDGYILQVDHTDIKAMTAEIQKIGVNVNQIAKRVNSTGSVYQEDIEEIKGVLAEIWRLQRLMTSPAMGTITFSDKLCIMENMPAFHPCGVCPTSAAIVPTFSFTSPNIVDRLPLMAPMRISFIHSLIASSMLCIS